VSHPFQIELEHIRRSLWTGSASVMVGAGFSRNALPLSSGARQFALWSDLLAEMEQRLGYSAPSGRSTSDALRLAAEFEDALGRPELDALLQRLIPDEQHEPGPLHVQLLRLPWADVFTTNYDTLLERSCRLVHETKYDIIRRTEDIPRARRPRIVKLSGTFPSNGPFIITEGDFRTYPRRFAPFVNMVQQAAMETTLVLVGFSGDDPNFLEWAGWVRDNLGPASPRIYLCGVLDLTPARLHMLRSRHIVPVDLGDTIPTHPDSGIRQRTATERLLNFFASGKPASALDWPEDLLKLGASAPGSQIWLWLRTIRRTYPGWIVCPETVRSRLSLSIGTRDLDTAELLATTASQAAHEQVLSLRDLAWPLDICLTPLPPELVTAIQQAMETVNPYPSQLHLPDSTVKPDNGVGVGLPWRDIAEAWVELGFALLSDARKEQDEGRFQLWSSRLKSVIDQYPEWRARWHHQQCLFLLATFQLSKLQAAMSEWSHEPANPEWDARRAVLIAELGDFDGALELARTSLEQVRRSQISREKEHRLLSSEGWLVHLCSCLARNATTHNYSYVRSMIDRQSTLEAELCNPESDIRERARRLREKVRARPSSDLKPSFDPGIWQASFRSDFEESWEWIWVVCLDKAALPEVLFESELLAIAAQELSHTHLRLAISLYVRSGGSDRTLGWLSRARVAVLPEREIAQLFDWLSVAISEALSTVPVDRANGGQQRGLSTRIIEVGVELLSRLAFRLSEERREQLFHIAIEVYRSEHMNISAVGGIEYLFRRLFLGAHRRELERWFPGLLALPVRSEDDFLPEPLMVLNNEAIHALTNIEHPKELPRIVEDLLSLVRNGSADQLRRAVIRLNVLFRAKALSIKQENAFAKALWDKITSDGMLAGVYLENGFILQLPEPTTGFAADCIRTAILRSSIPSVNKHRVGDEVVYSANEAIAWLRDLIHCTKYSWLVPTVRERRIEWTKDEAITLLDKISDWCSKNPWQSIANYSVARIRRGTRRELVLALDHVLSIVLFPRLDGASPDVKERGLVLARMLIGLDYPSIISRVGVLLLAPEAIEESEDIIRKALSSSDLDIVHDAASAIVIWARYTSPRGQLKNPALLIDELVSSIAFRWDRSPRLIEIIGELPSEMLKETHLVSLAIALQQLADATLVSSQTDNDDMPEIDSRAGLRAAGAGLAGLLLAICKSRSWTVPSAVEQWSRIIPAEVLPEVRLAWEKAVASTVKEERTGATSKKQPPRSGTEARHQARRPRSSSAKKGNPASKRKRPNGK
jgi:hypothetical protein